ncbi:hypothetical protein [Massilia sp. Dwa41.01b]|uniref:hypothetical protein n=1 Tax=Massilia sp. Dwa41.01b TaxID=2709302 RepID=UPI0035A71842
MLGGLVAVSVHGNATCFGVIHTGTVGLSLLLPGLVLALCTGLAGGLLSRLLIASTGGQGATP